jgi:hypothetical protein
MSKLRRDVFKASKTAIPVCAPGHERRLFTGIIISDEDREAILNGIKCLVLRIRYRYWGNTTRSSGPFFVLSDDSRKQRHEYQSTLLDIMRRNTPIEGEGEGGGEGGS